MQIERVPLAALKPYENNPRINDGAVEAVAESIRQCGYCAPIVVDENMVILAGHTRHAEKENLKKMYKEMPKYSYPDHVITAAIVGRWSKYGIDYRLNKEDCVFISALDEQKECDKSVFGAGLLLSDSAAERAAAEKAAAEKAKAQCWKLSERELEIVRKLGKHDKEHHEQ